MIKHVDFQSSKYVVCIQVFHINIKRILLYLPIYFTKRKYVFLPYRAARPAACGNPCPSYWGILGSACDRTGRLLWRTRCQCSARRTRRSLGKHRRILMKITSSICSKGSMPESVYGLAGRRRSRKRCRCSVPS